jgi:two-component system, NarL family, sensor histidine kinase EvgS
VRLPIDYDIDHYEPYRPETQTPAIPAPVRVSAVDKAAIKRRPTLIVDDHPTNRRLLAQQLEWLGYACEPYGDAQSALARLLEQLPTDMPYSMVITDCRMPGMDGYELAHRIRAAEAGRSHRTVLIAFTADLSRSVAELTAASGFDAVLSKPMDLTTLKTNLEQLMPSVHHSPLAVDIEKTTSAQKSSPLELLKDATVRDEFHEAHEEDIEMLKSGTGCRDGALVARAAHRIRGAANMIGFQALSEAATALGDAVPNGDWEQIDSLARKVYLATEQLYRLFERGRQPESEEQDVL